MSVLSDIVKGLIGAIPDVIKKLTAKPKPQLEEPLGRSEADKVRQDIDDARKARQHGVH